MKLKTLALSVICLTALSASLAAEEVSVLTGRWVTDAVLTARPGNGNRFGEHGGYFGAPKNTQDPCPRFQLLQFGPSPRDCFPVPAYGRREDDSPALAMELKGSKSKVKGTLTDVVRAEEYKIEGGKVEGETFEFVIEKKVGGVKVKTTYRGRSLDRDTLTIQRLKMFGEPMDLSEVGKPVSLIFHRVKSAKNP